MVRLWIAIAVLAGCVDRVAIGNGVCGNWVLEPGEDCDRPGGVCTADCRIRCDPDMPQLCAAAFDGACCPDGFACGVDQACHAPSGAFAATEVATPVELTAFRVADVNGDHIADVLGYSADAVRAFYGSALAPLSVATTTAAPPSSGTPAIGDYDGDGRLDVVWPVASGLLAFASATGRPEPVSFPNQTSSGRAHLRIGALGSNLVYLDHRTDNDLLALSDDAGHAPHTPCSHAFAPSLLTGRAMHPYADGSTGDRILVPLVFRPTPENLGQPPFVCVDGPGLISPMTTFAPSTTTISEIGEAFYARLDPAEACPDLLVPVEAGGLPVTVVVASLASPQGCEIVGGPALAYIGAPLAPLSLADGNTALVTSEGVYEASADCEASAGLCQIVAATRPWSYAVVGDFDGDGLDDVAVASTDSDVEVVLQRPFGWVVKRIATGGAAVDLAAGDFDGDGVLDLAIAVADPADPRGVTVQFAFGGGGTFAAGTTPLRFVELNGMVVAPLDDPGAAPGLARADGLALVAGDDVTSSVTYVFGSPDRVPIAPFVYIGFFDGLAKHAGQALAALIGAFGAGNTPGILGLFSPAPSEVTVQPDLLELASLSASVGYLSVDRADTLGACPPAGFCPATSVLASVAGPDATLVFAFAASDDSADCGGFALSSEAVPSLEPLPCSVNSASLRDITLAHAVDGDGTAAPRIALGTASGLTVWSVGLVNGMPTFDTPVNFASLIASASGAHATCVDAIAIELGTREVDGASFGAGRELVAACRIAGQTVVLAAFAPAVPMAPPLLEPLFAIPGEPAISLGAGDVDGDGVEDLVYTTHDAGVATLHARLQCDSHTTCGAP